MAKYNKTIVAIVGAVIGWVTLVVASPASHISSSEWIQGATLLAVALGVYTVGNVTG